MMTFPIVSCKSLFQPTANSHPNTGTRCITAEIGWQCEEDFEIYPEDAHEPDRVFKVLTYDPQSNLEAPEPCAGKQQTLLRKRSNVKLSCALICGVLVLVFSTPLAVSGNLRDTWSNVCGPTVAGIHFSELKRCELDMVCAAPSHVPKGVFFEKKDVPWGLELDRNTGELKGPGSVDASAAIVVVARSAGSWCTPASQQTVEVRQHASRAEDASMQRAVVGAVETVSVGVFGLLGLYALECLWSK